MNIRTDLRLDKAQFAAWAEHQEERYELVDGRVVMLPQVTRNHALICTNVVVALAQQLDRSRYGITQGDFAVETGDRSIRYADVMVEKAGGDGKARTTIEPLVLFEVLSSSTTHVDFGAKLTEYRALPTLGSYVIFAQDAARAWAWSRSEGVWPDNPVIVEGLDATFALPILNAEMPLAEIYRGIVLS